MIETICIRIYHKKEKKRIKINFWGISGQERFFYVKINIRTNIIIFYIENENTFHSIKDFWYKECNKLLELSNCLKILLKTIGYKIRK